MRCVEKKSVLITDHCRGEGERNWNARKQCSSDDEFDDDCNPSWWNMKINHGEENWGINFDMKPKNVRKQADWSRRECRKVQCRNFLW
jgi:hypothetical protein